MENTIYFKPINIAKHYYNINSNNYHNNISTSINYQHHILQQQYIKSLKILTKSLKTSSKHFSKILYQTKLHKIILNQSQKYINQLKTQFNI